MKLTKIQAHALEQARRLGDTFTFMALLDMPSIGSGRTGTSGFKVDGPANMTVNTVHALITKGAIELVKLRIEYFKSVYRITD